MNVCSSLRTAAELIEIINDDAVAGEPQYTLHDVDQEFENEMDCVTFMAVIAAKHYAGQDISDV